MVVGGSLEGQSPNDGASEMLFGSDDELIYGTNDDLIYDHFNSRNV